MPNSATFFASGKLFILGEYAVVTGKSPAILVPTTKGIRVTVRKAKEFKIENHQFKGQNQTFHHLAELKEPLVRLAMEVVRQYVQEVKGEFSPFSLKITSLISSSDVKYGLGSSGALVVACIGGLLKFYGIKTTPLVRYKLAVKAMVDHQTSSSYADLAVSSFNKPIRYQKFNDGWQSRLKTLSVMNAIDMEWDGLSIDVLKASPLLKPLVIFTGHPASSSLFVSNVMPNVKDTNINALKKLISSYQTYSIPHLLSEVNAWFKELEKDSHQPLFTPEIEDILNLLKQFGGAGKFSGAGGGDCVIGYIEDDIQRQHALKVIKKKYLVLEGMIA
jgi:phosphomevalonate kinase